MNYIILFFGLITVFINSGCTTKNENKPHSSLNAQQRVLESNYVMNNHQAEKKLLRKKIKALDGSLQHELHDFSEWLTNVGEAIDMME